MELPHLLKAPPISEPSRRCIVESSYTAPPMLLEISLVAVITISPSEALLCLMREVDEDGEGGVTRGRRMIELKKG
ncbi:UDP-N-acetylmuramoyl-tripeptide--D-alanyl-D-alanine ligase [Sesbania bispinosa]|nr:UDP-N-acetylmuramoyl-tripeptide--D-alanyl-D-alanine ligase [Sesbania bispinosa]